MSKTQSTTFEIVASEITRVGEALGLAGTFGMEYGTDKMLQRIAALAAPTPTADAMETAQPLRIPEWATDRAREVVSFLETGEAFGVDLQDEERYAAVNRIAYEITSAAESAASAQQERLVVLEKFRQDASAPLQVLANLDLTKTLSGKTDDYPLFGLNGAIITVGDVRNARAALAKL